MTIPQLAKELELTPQAIYSRLKKNCINKAELLVDNTSQLSTEGETLIRKLFEHSSKVVQASKKVESNKLKALSNTALKESLIATKERCTRLETQNESLVRELEEMKQMYSDMKQLNMELIKAMQAKPALLSEGDRSDPEKGFFRRLFKRKK